MPIIARQFGMLIYVVPIILGIIGILMTRWYAAIGIPLGWALFTPIAFRWFYDIGKGDSLSLEQLKVDLEKTKLIVMNIERSLSYPSTINNPTYKCMSTETKRNLRHFRRTKKALQIMIDKKERMLKKGHLTENKQYLKKAIGFTLVEIIIVVAIVALLATIATPYVLRSRLNANEGHAQATLKTISNAFETYAAANGGNYPTAIEDLTDLIPPYLNEDYTSAARQGYNFSCDSMGVAGYTCTATPSICGTTGNKNFTITTGGILTSNDCNVE